MSALKLRFDEKKFSPWGLLWFSKTHFSSTLIIAHNHRPHSLQFDPRHRAHLILTPLSTSIWKKFILKIESEKWLLTPITPMPSLILIFPLSPNYLAAWHKILLSNVANGQIVTKRDFMRMFNEPLACLIYLRSIWHWTGMRDKDVYAQNNFQTEVEHMNLLTLIRCSFGNLSYLQHWVSRAQNILWFLSWSPSAHWNWIKAIIVSNYHTTIWIIKKNFVAT